MEVKISNDQISTEAFEADIHIEVSVTLGKDENNKDRYSDLEIDGVFTR